MLVQARNWSDVETEILLQDIFAPYQDVAAKLSLTGSNRSEKAIRCQLDKIRKAQGYSLEYVKPEVQKAGGKTIVALHDWHVPYHDPAALECAFKFCEKVNPSIILVHEVHDFYALSRFNKDPDRSSGVDLQREVDIAHDLLADLVKRCPSSKVILLSANHTDRLQRYLWSDAKGLAGVRCLEISKFMGLPDIGIDYMQEFTYKDFLWKHGDIVRSDSSYTAKGEYLREGTSGASGHTHRIGTYYITKRGGGYVWVEGGCLCLLNPEYIKGTPNWQNGIAVVEFEPGGSQFLAQPVPILKGKLFWGGQLITA